MFGMHRIKRISIVIPVGLYVHIVYLFMLLSVSVTGRNIFIISPVPKAVCWTRFVLTLSLLLRLLFMYLSGSV
jgi:hypothetical protein